MKSIVIGSCLLLMFTVGITESVTKTTDLVTSDISYITKYKVLWDNDERTVLFKSFDKVSALNYYMEYKSNHDMFFVVVDNGIEQRIMEKDFGKLK